MVSVTCFTDPGCPFAWSAMPALTALRWRYGRGLEWELHMIGLAETPEHYERRGYTPLAMAKGWGRFRRYGMPFSPQPKPRVAATSLACRAIVAVRETAPGREWGALHALHRLQFCTPMLLDDPEAVRMALETVSGIDAATIVDALESDAVWSAYDADREAARTAAGSPAEAQGKAAQTDGPVRFTAPSLIFRAGGLELVAGGFQPLEAYDVLIANLDPTLERRGAPDDPAELLAAFPDGLVTAEAAAVMELSGDDAEAALLEAVADGDALRASVGDDALWIARPGARLRLVA